MTWPSCSVCPAPAVVIVPGTDGTRAEIGTLVGRAVPDRIWCLTCATRSGWPWLKSECPPTPATDYRQQALPGIGW